MKFELNLSKMSTEYAFPIRYFLKNGDEEIFMNDFIGKKLSITYLHQINCVSCGCVTAKSYMNGHCYKCYATLPECDEGVFNPEKDLSHLGISRDIEWSKKYSLIDHYVYLAITGDLKVGVTRHNQLPTRWIDQGATYAIRFAKTPNRNLAGLIEVEMKKLVSDKTNWRRMLMFAESDINLVERKHFYLPQLPDELKIYESYDDSIVEMDFPYRNSVGNLKNVYLDSSDVISGTLMGIKGQYLIFDNGAAFNVRSHSGYLVGIDC